MNEQEAKAKFFEAVRGDGEFKLNLDYMSESEKKLFEEFRAKVMNGEITEDEGEFRSMIMGHFDGDEPENIVLYDPTMGLAYDPEGEMFHILYPDGKLDVSFQCAHEQWEDMKQRMDELIAKAKEAFQCRLRRDNRNV